MSFRIDPVTCVLPEEAGEIDSLVTIIKFSELDCETVASMRTLAEVQVHAARGSGTRACAVEAGDRGAVAHGQSHCLVGRELELSKSTVAHIVKRSRVA